MKILQLRKIKKKYFNLRQFANTLNMPVSSAKVTASRYVKARALIRPKRDLYVSAEQWEYLTPEDKFQLANLIQTPSYISLLTALSYYEISTQIQREFIESVAIKRTKQVEVKGTVFNYTKIKKELYFGFVRVRDFFIAEPEKALLDAFYLTSLNKYTLDIEALDFDKIDKEKLLEFLPKFPVSVQKMVNYYELV
jgi:predicted transcriptional regulator of viral defense system